MRWKYFIIGSILMSLLASWVYASNIQNPGGSGSIDIGTTPITLGTDTRVLFDDAATVGEDAGFTYNKTTDILTLIGGFIWAPTVGDSFEAVPTGSVFRIVNTTDGITSLIHYADNAVGLGETGFAPIEIRLITDGTGDNELKLPSSSVGLPEVDFTNSPAAGQFVSFTGNRFTWATTSAAGANPAGTGSEVQYRVDGTTFGAVTSSSVAGANITLGGDLNLSYTTPAYKLTPNAGDAFELVAAGSTVRVVNTTDNITSLIHYGDNGVGLGEVGFAPGYIRLQTDGTGDAELQLPLSSVGYGEMAVSNTPTDGQFLSFSSALGTWQWTTSSGSGDITSVGDVISGAAFDGTQGTILTFNNAGGDATVDYDGTDFSFNKDVDVNEAIPLYRWTDTTASEDDFEAVAQTSVFRISNTTDNITSLIHYGDNGVGLGETGFAPAYIKLTSDGTGSSELLLPDQSVDSSELAPSLVFQTTMELSGVLPQFTFTDTSASEDDFEVVAQSSVFRILNTTDRITSLIHYANNGVGLGEVGFAPGYINLVTDGTGDQEVQLPLNSVGYKEISVPNAPTDSQVLSYSSALGSWQWAAASASGDITSVGDVTTGAAFDGTQGTTLTFNNAGGDATVDYDGTDFSFSKDVDVQEAIPLYRWTDTTSSEDDFEAVAQTSVFRISNTTDNITSLIHYADNSVGLGEAGFAPAYIKLTTDGTGSSELQLPGSSVDSAELAASLVFQTTMELSGTLPQFTFTDTTASEDDFEITAESSVFRIVNTTDRITSLIHYADNGIGLGEVGFAPGYVKVTTTGTGDGAVQLPNSSVGYKEMAVSNTPTDAQVLSFNAATGDWRWVTSSGSGDITSVGDVTTGAAFDGTQGRTLTFFNAGGNGTLDYDGTSLTSNKPFVESGATITISNTIPSYVWTDTSASEDDFEALAETSVFRIVNTTDKITSLIHYANNSVGLGEAGYAPASIILTTDGTGDGELEVPNQSISSNELAASLVFQTTMELSGALPQFSFTDTTAAEDDFEIAVQSSVFRIVNTTDRITSLIHYADNGIGLGEAGYAPTYIKLLSDGTGDQELELPNNSVGYKEVSVSNSPTDGQFLSFKASTGNWQWATANGTGDITSVGDVLSGAAFDGTQGTSLTFFNAGGNGTFSYDGTSLTANKPLVETGAAITVSNTIPSYVWTDTTASEDDFEALAESSVFRVTNTTDKITSLIHYADNSVGLGEVGFAPTYVRMVTDGTGNGEVVLPDNSVGSSELDTSLVFQTTMELSGTVPQFSFTDTTASEDDFEAVVQSSVFRIVNTTDGITSLIHYANNGVGLGEVGFAPTYLKFITDGTGDLEFQVPDQSIGMSEVDSDLPKASFGITIDGGGSAISTGAKGYVTIPYNCTINSWDIFADQSGSVVVDVWKDTYANFPPTVADTIAGTSKPTLSAAQKNQDLTLSTWTTTVIAGDVIGFNVDSATTVTRVNLIIKVTKT